MEVSTSGYYIWRKKLESNRSQQNKKLLAHIKTVHHKSRQTYGSPRIHIELKRQGIICSQKRIAQLMKNNAIVANRKRKFIYTTDSKHTLPVAENKLDQHFEASNTNEKWVTDITYVPTKQGWLYLAIVLDLFSRKVVGWSMQATLKKSLVIDALQMALQLRRPGKGLLHHSDRGSQYCSYDYQNLLRQYNIICSMSRKGNCYDNAAMESFFSTLKQELIYHQQYENRAQAKLNIFEYIQVWYNRQRRHSSLGYESPEQFEQRWQYQQAA
jgi:putative transposase